MGPIRERDDLHFYTDSGCYSVKTLKGSDAVCKEAMRATGDMQGLAVALRGGGTLLIPRDALQRTILEFR